MTETDVPTEFLIQGCRLINDRPELGPVTPEMWCDRIDEALHQAAIEFKEEIERMVGHVR